MGCPMWNELGLIMQHVVDFLITYVLVVIYYFLDSGYFRPFASLIMTLVLIGSGYLIGKLYYEYKNRINK